MSVELVQTRRDAIDYHRRKFRLNLTGIDAAGEWEWSIPPPNEFAYSDRFNQCLVMISKVFLSNQGDTVAGGVDTVIQNAAAAVEPCGSGILLRTRIPTANQGNYSAGHHADGALSYPGVQALIPNKGNMSLAAAYGGLAAIGSSALNRGGAAGGAGLQGTQDNIYSVKTWEYKDDRSIEQAGVLCGNIFGTPLFMELVDPITEVKVNLVSGTNLANAATRHSSIAVELDVLMLENPRAE